MKRYLLFIVPVIGLFSMGAAVAQPHKGAFSFSAETRYEAPFGAGKEFSAIDIDAVFGYCFNERWSIILPVTGSTGLFDVDNARSYETALLAGLGCRYDVLRHSNCSLELSSRVQTTMGGDWKYMAYDVGVRCRWTNAPYAGIGLRYIDTYDSPFKSRFCIYVSFGFTLF